jgi:TonB-linked SusC/RagA family outer membrane protein
MEEYTLNNLLIYETTWRKHSLNALAGYSQISNQEKTLFASRNDFYNNDVQSLSQGSDASRGNGGVDMSWGLRSYFGRFTYNFSEKYFFEANARYDGSSRFTGNNKYSFFPSFSGAWRVSQEPFWASLSHIVDEFKIRGSWGKSGNQSVPLYSYFETLAASNYNFNNSSAQGIALATLANQNLTWETTTQTDIGTDLQFLKGKFGMTFDYFKKRTDGILLTLPIPAVVGLNPPPQNAGVVENKGWEFSLTHRSNIGGLRYSVTGNISDMKNRIISLEGTGPYITGTTGNTLTVRQEGDPIDAYIGFKSLGLFQSKDEVSKYPVFDPATSAGDVKYADLNNDGKITTADLTVIGSDIPRYTFGINSNLQFKGFDMNIFFQGVGKANAIPEGALRQMGNWGAFALDMHKDYWTPENPQARFPRPVKEKNINTQMSDFWMINTAYLKLKNLQIGYTFPSAFAEKIRIQRMRMYVSGSNLFTISKATAYGLDPEFPSGRVAYYPQLALYTVGVNVTF